MESIRRRIAVRMIVFLLLVALSGTGLLPCIARPVTVAAQEPEPVNLAAAANGGRIVFASVDDEEYPAANLIDGYKLDYGEWIAQSLDFPLAIVVELGGGPHLIDRVVLNPWTSDWRLAWVKEFEIYASADSSDLAQMDAIGAYTLEHFGVDQTFTFEPVEAKYVGLVILSNYNHQQGVLLNEFEVYGPSSAETGLDRGPAEVKPDNLAAAANGGSIVDFSSEDPNGKWPVTNLIDSRNRTPESWSSADTKPPQYVVFGLRGHQPWTVDRVVLNPYSDGYPEDWIKEFELRGSATDWNIERMDSLGTFTLRQTGEDQSFTFAPTLLRYIAVIPLSNYGGTAFGLNEFEVYAVPGKRPQPVKRLGEPTAIPEPSLVTQTDGMNRPAPVDSRPKQPSPTPTVPVAPVSIANVDIEINYSALVPLIYHLYGQYFESLVLTTFTNNNPFPITVWVEATVLEYTQSDVKMVMLDPGETYTIEQNPVLLTSAWGLLNQNRDASLQIKIENIAGEQRSLLYEETWPLVIYAANNFPWNIPGFHNGTIFLAAMVTPNNAKIDELMRRAADYSPTGTIGFGYGDETDSDHLVFNKMKAIYQAVASYGVTYVATGVDFVPITEREHGFTMQRLKFPDEALSTTGAMCVELSTLFASAFEYILLDPVLITIPGHVYVAVPISKNSDIFYFLETTVINRATFEEAVQIAAKDWNDATRAEMEKDVLDDYFWLAIKEARVEGITPIPIK